MKTITVRASNNERKNSLDVKIRPIKETGPLVMQEDEAYAEAEILYHELSNNLSHYTWEKLKAKIIQAFVFHNVKTRRQSPGPHEVARLHKSAEASSLRLFEFLERHNSPKKYLGVECDCPNEKGVPVLLVRHRTTSAELSTLRIMIGQVERYGWEGFPVRTSFLPAKEKKRA